MGNDPLELQDEETLPINWLTITYIFRNKNLIFSTEIEKTNMENRDTLVYTSK